MSRYNALVVQHMLNGIDSLIEGKIYDVDSGICYNLKKYMSLNYDYFTDCPNMYSFVTENINSWKHEEYIGLNVFPIPQYPERWEGRALELRIDLLQHFKTLLIEGTFIEGRNW